ncbi:MAG: hypothetical protein J5501_05195 [Ruminococcus sp.]|nr:hypothetical protein [Ruminococcus sp.]
MYWTKTIKNGVKILFIVVVALAAVSSLISMIRYHSNFFSELFSLTRSIVSYALTFAALLVTCEISENVYDIKMGNKTPASLESPVFAAKPAAPAAAAKEEKEDSANAE